MVDKDYTFDEKDFELVQENVVIKDKKLDTKPTTFFKDAIRRFAKNKASVMAAFILGVLILLAIFVPIFCPYNIEKDYIATPQQFIAPKLFKTGTGFWDGTVKYKHIAYSVDEEIPDPEHFFKRAIVGEPVVTKELVNQVNKYGHGGYVMFATTSTDPEGTDVYLRTQKTTFSKSGEYKVAISFLNEDNALSSKLGEYKIILFTEAEEEILLKDWSKDYPENLEIDISKALTDAGIDSVSAQFRFILKHSTQNLQYILIKSVQFSCKQSMANYKNLVGGEDADGKKIPCFSFTDATQMIYYDTTSTDREVDYTTLDDYWGCNGRKGIYNSELYFADFVYDTYEHVYGGQPQYVSLTTLEKWQNDKWITFKYDAKYVPEKDGDEYVNDTDFAHMIYIEDLGTFYYTILDQEKCPIAEIFSFDVIKRGTLKKLNTVVGEFPEWMRLGFKKMPSYIMGTDVTGRSLFAYAFAGLRTSLILGLCTAAFCFAFGLIWGAISGYFGGNVDIAMERFCEILSGVPWVVIMTLCILHLGRSFFVFFLALCMTGWMGTAGRTRAQFYRFKGREYVLASRTLGSSDLRLIFRHILPNSMGTIITGSVLMIPSTIFSEASIAYLQLGLQDKQSFGVMMANNQQYLDNHAYVVIFPAVIMALMMISFNLFGNGLRDAFNPSLKGSD